MRSVEQCWCLKAEWNGYSDGLCRTYVAHAPAHRAVSWDPLLTYHHHSHIYIEVAMVMIVFVGVTTFDKSGKGATSILQSVVWVSPKRQLRNTTMAPSSSYYASCAAARGAAVVHSVLRLW